MVAAVVFDPARPRINGLDDSKRLAPPRRELLYERIVERALAYSVVFVEVEEIDRRNILNASLLAMVKALKGLRPRPGAQPDGRLVSGQPLRRAGSFRGSDRLRIVHTIDQTQALRQSPLA